MEAMSNKATPALSRRRLVLRKEGLDRQVDRVGYAIFGERLSDAATSNAVPNPAHID
jgi:hypothetical protein